MWRPRRLGKVIAERTLTLHRPRRRPTRVRVRFGCPVRAPGPEPWWCPVQITGLGKPKLEKVPGEDSLQALILALEFMNRMLPDEAARVGGGLLLFDDDDTDRVGRHLRWLGERENLIFAHMFMARLAGRSLQNCVTGLADAVALLEQGGTGRANVALAQWLRALVASGGYTDDPRRIARSDRPWVRPGTKDGVREKAPAPAVRRFCASETLRARWILACGNASGYTICSLAARKGGRRG